MLGGQVTREDWTAAMSGTAGSGWRVEPAVMLEAFDDRMDEGSVGGGVGGGEGAIESSQVSDASQTSFFDNAFWDTFSEGRVGSPTLVAVKSEDDENLYSSDSQESPFDFVGKRLKFLRSYGLHAT